MKLVQLLTTVVLATALQTHALAEEVKGKAVGITADKMSVTVKHDGKDFEIKRNQENSATIAEAFSKTSRPCPPFCIQPDKVADGVDTIAELGILDYLEKLSAGDESILVIDSRTPDWVAKGSIPGSKNIPWTSLSPKKGASTDDIIEIMDKEFNVKMKEGEDSLSVDEAIAEGSAAEKFDYSNAKTLVMFCNGMWCGQSPTNIRTLLKFGYPAEKIKWYRGGMQSWNVVGLATVKAE